MQEIPGYGRALFYAIGLHLILIGLLMTDSSSTNPVLKKAKEIVPNAAPVAQTPKQEIVNAVSVDNSEVLKKVNEIKAAQARQKQQEINRQKQLQKEVMQAKQARLQEQKKLQQLKLEAEKIAIARKKKIEEEKKRLKELAEEKVKEEKRLAELKTKQEKLKKEHLDELKKAEEKKKVDDAKAKALAKVEQERLAKLKQEQARKQQELADAEARDAEKRAQMAGEVDKYKALILNAISRQWIFPDNVDSSLSSQFRLRLAPDGSVLEVTLLRSSGDPVLDRSAKTAILKASPLPVPSDPLVFDMFRDINLTVRPEQSRG